MNRKYCVLAIFIAVIFLSISQLTAQEKIHVLQRGETIYGLARTYGVSANDILTLNKISDPGKLQVGQKIRIPVAVSYSKIKVKRGDTLYALARKYDLTVAELCQINGISQNALLKEGQVLKVPLISNVTAIAQVRPSPTPQRTVDIQSSPPPISTSSIGSPAPAVKADASVVWPIQAKDIAYMQGKLYGVSLGGSEHEMVKSLSPGTVVSAGPYRGFGNVVIVQGPESHVFVYGGCSELTVKEGDSIHSGTVIGSLGVDSLSGKALLHMLVYKNGKAIDPAKAPRF